MEPTDAAVFPTPSMMSGTDTPTTFRTEAVPTLSVTYVRRLICYLCPCSFTTLTRVRRWRILCHGPHRDGGLH